MANKKIWLVILTAFLLVLGSSAVYAATRCIICGGDGWATCTVCRGSGKSGTGVQHADGSFTAKDCMACRGLGLRVCTSCGGDGWR